MEIYTGRNASRRGGLKICHGLYLSAEPSPHQLAEILTRRWPDSALDGYSAAAKHLDRPLNFPLQLIRANRLPESTFFKSRRAQPKGVFLYDEVNVCNPLQALEIMTEDHAVDFLEHLLPGRHARERLKLWELDFKRFPQHTRRVLERAILGADSVPERQLTRALELHFEVRNNAMIGPYRWDILLDKHRIAIEVDGYAYHSGETRQRFELDRQKLNDAAHRGWIPLHYTATTIKHHCDKVVDQVVAIAHGKKSYLRPPWDWHLLWSHEREGTYSRRPPERSA